MKVWGIISILHNHLSINLEKTCTLFSLSLLDPILLFNLKYNLLSHLWTEKILSLCIECILSWINNLTSLSGSLICHDKRVHKHWGILIFESSYNLLLKEFLIQFLNLYLLLRFNSTIGIHFWYVSSQILIDTYMSVLPFHPYLLFI